MITKPSLFFLFSLLFMGTLFTSCKKSEISHEASFEKSYKEWLSFKKGSGNSYQYTVAWSSWTGMSWQTVITVRHGKVVKRNFQYFLPADWPVEIPADKKAWTENEGGINSHQDGAEAVTLDEIYAKTRNYWLKKRDNVKTYFEAKNNGLISSCGYVENGCADDCFNGIDIINIGL